MMNDANENENDLIALPFSSLFSSLFFLLFVWLWRAFFFLFFFWASLHSPLSKVSFVCSSLRWTRKKKKKKRKDFPPSSKLSLFLCFAAAALFFFCVFDETERHETDLMRAHSERKISQKEREKSRRRTTNAKTSKRENARFAKRKRRLSRSKRREQRFIPSTFFRVVAIRDTTPALLYSRARYRTTFCRPRRKGGRIFARCLT